MVALGYIGLGTMAYEDEDEDGAELDLAANFSLNGPGNFQKRQ